MGVLTRLTSPLLILTVWTACRLQQCGREERGAADIPVVVGMSVLGVGLLVTLFQVFEGRLVDIVHSMFDQFAP